MSDDGPLPDDTALTVNEVAALTDRTRADVLQAIGRGWLLARADRGDWTILARDMRRWATRH